MEAIDNLSRRRKEIPNSVDIAIERVILGCYADLNQDEIICVRLSLDFPEMRSL
jgi:hypothetical protein